MEPKRLPSKRAPAAKLPRLRIGFVLAPRFTLTAFAGFVDAIRIAADEADLSRQIDCQWSILANGEEFIEASCGLKVKPWERMCDPERFDYIAVVGGLLHGGQKIVPGTYSFLKTAARMGIPLIGVCTGSFILARAGLLKGYEVCVSFLHREEFHDEFPHLRVQPNKKFVLDRNRLTCTGGTSSIHVAAHLIQKHCGRTQALKSIRNLAEEEVLPASAWQPEEVVTYQARDDTVRQAMLLIDQDLGDPRSLASISKSLGISISKMERRFIDDVGISPREYRMRLRLDRAKWMVEHTDRSMTEIGLQCGFNGGAYFSRIFKERFGIQPSDARRRQKTKDNRERNVPRLSG